MPTRSPSAARSLRAAALLALSAASAPAEGQPAVTVPVAASGTLPSVTVGRQVDLPILVRSASAKPQRLAFTATIQGPNGGFVKAVEVAPHEAELNDGDQVELTVKAQLTAPGDYVLTVEVRDRDLPAGKPFTIGYRLIWPKAAADALDAQVDASATLRAATGATVAPTFTVTATARPLTLSAPALIAVEQAEGAGYVATGLTGTVQNCAQKAGKTQPEAAKEAKLLWGGSACYRLALNEVGEAGTYRARVRIADADGGAKLIDLPFTAKAPLWWAALCLVGGAVIGALISTWQGPLRERFAATEAALAAEEELLRLVAAARGLFADAGALGNLVQIAADGVEAARRGTAFESNKLAARTRQLSVWIAQWYRAAVLPVGDRPAQASTDALRALDQPLAEDAAPTIDALVEAVTKALAARPPAAASAAAGPIAVDRLADLIRPPRDLAKLRRSRGRWEVLAQVLLFGLFAVVALDQLYGGDPDWGSSRDRILMLLIGASAFGGIGAAVASFRQTASRPA